MYLYVWYFILSLIIDVCMGSTQYDVLALNRTDWYVRVPGAYMTIDARTMIARWYNSVVACS